MILVIGRVRCEPENRDALIAQQVLRRTAELALSLVYAHGRRRLAYGLRAPRSRQPQGASTL